MERGTTAKADFARAAAHERELNGRQRQVLDLLVAGKTNGEIADALEMTFDGAKWNVSEILSKLGLESREEAARYWRWRNAPRRRMARWARGLLGTTAAKVALGAGGAGMVGAAVLLFWLTLGGGDATPASGGPRSFYLEASVIVKHGDDSTGVNPYQTLGVTGAREERSSLRWWYQDRDHSRWEVDRSSQSLDATSISVVYDGREQWFLDSALQIYTRTPIAQLPAEIVYRPIELSSIVGPVNARSVADYVDSLRNMRPGVHAGIVGEDILLGRRVQIVEFEPTSYSSTGTTGGPGTPTPTKTESRGTMRSWIDPATLFVLRSEVVDSGQSDYSAEVTRLDFDVKVPKAELQATVPVGWQDMGSASSVQQGSSAATAVASGSPPPTTPVSQSSLSFAPPFLSPAYVPAGYSQRGSGGSDNSVSAELWSGSDWLRIEERARPTGLPKSLQTGKRAALPGNIPGYLQDIGSDRALAFAKGAVSVLITASGLSDEELVRVAESMLE